MTITMENSDLNKIHRILHIIPTLGSGGAERVLLTYLSQPALKQGFRHLVVLTDVADPHSDIPETFLVKLLEEQGVEVIGLGLPGSRNVFKSIIALKRLIRERKIDLVHTQLLWSNIAGRLAGRWAGVPVISSFQNTDYDPQVLASVRASYWKQDIIRRLDGWTTRYCVEKSVAVSNYVAKHIEFKLGLNPSKIQVIHNITDSVQTTPTVSGPRQKVLRELKLSDDVQIVLTVGRVTDQKAHLELVEAFARIINQHSKTYLVIIGAKIDKPYLNRLEELISSKALVDRVLLLGARRDIPDWLAAADIFVFPSKYEGLPVALSEALVAGLPCISTSVGAIPELIRHEETGLLVPLNNVSALASSISGLLNNEVLRKNLVLGARADILSRLNPTKKSQEMADLYRQTMMLFK